MMLDSPTRTADPPRLGAIAPEVVLELKRLLQPELIEVKGCVLLPWAYEPQNFESWWERLKGDRSAIEGVLNHVHLWDVFDTETNESVLDELAKIIAESWRGAAVSRFPERHFDITISQGDGDYGPTVYLRSGPAIASADASIH